MLDVLDPGVLTTVQDRGRAGWARYGIPESGAMDRAAFAAANRLVGNAPDAAALEITLVGPLLRVREEALVAICGAGFGVSIDGIPAPGWHSVFVRAGSLIRFGDRRWGARAYLAIAGGIALAPVLGSRSTYLPGGLGGFRGRALCRGDALPVGRDPGQRRPHELWASAGTRWPETRRPAYTSAPTLRVILGPQDDHFDPAALDRFLEGPYVLSPAADRMGVRMQGPVIVHRGPAGIVSDGVVCGSVQVPPDGQPIVMMVDHQTTGGYPKIATVVQADLPLLAQCLPGDTVRFRAVALAEARAATRHCLKSVEDFR